VESARAAGQCPADEDDEEDDDEDESSCCPTGGVGRDRAEACDDSAAGGGGKTVEIGGRETPLMQLLEHTLSLVLQLCMH
jgi:hypothetical protein